MKRRILVALASSAMLATSLVAAPTTAQAAGAVTVTSPSCGKIKFVNTTPSATEVGVDNGMVVSLPANNGYYVMNVPGGVYTWGITTSPSAPRGSIAVSTCPGARPRAARGDFTGDGVADVLAVTTTGDLYSYAMTSVALAPGRKVGYGWGTTRWMQRVEDWTGAGSVTRKLISVRNDGTVWRYDDLGAGRFGTGVKMGQGFGSFTSFAVLPANNQIMPGVNFLVATKPGYMGVWAIAGNQLAGQTLEQPYSITRLVGMQDFNGDRFADLEYVLSDGRMLSTNLSTDKIVGSGWGGMTTIASPGSLDKDRLSDLITRHSNGNLYKYTNRGGRWGEAQRIGVNWNGIRFLA